MSDVCHKAANRDKTVHPHYPNIKGYMIKCTCAIVVDVDPPAVSRNWKNVTCKNCLKRKK